MLGVPPVVLLLARLLRSDLPRLPHHQLVPQPGQHLRKPARVARGLDPHQRRLLQPGVESPRFPVLVLQLLFHDLARLRVQHRNLLRARVEITAYNHHVRLLLR
jgi:murein L,D-transpeptidase YcbB/YkuD